MNFTDGPENKRSINQSINHFLSLLNISGHFWIFFSLIPPKAKRMNNHDDDADTFPVDVTVKYNWEPG
jgi:hypothetical protein